MTTTVDPILLDTARRLFAELAGADPAQAWTALVDTGLPWLGIAEDAGGEGGTLADALAVVAESARHAAAVPLAENWIAASLLAAAGIPVERAASPLTVAAAPAQTHDGTVVVPRVPYVETATAVATELDGRVLLFPIAAARSVTPSGTTGEPRATLRFDDVTAAVSASATGPAADRLGAVTRSVQLAAALDGALQLTTVYAGQREQFGRPIARFQAVAHLIAQLGEQAAVAGMAADLGVAGALRGDWSQTAIAKSVSGSAAGLGARFAHQVHGAIGVTEEYALPALTARLLTWRDDFGAEPAWNRTLGSDAAGLDQAALWRIVLGETPAHH